MCLFLGAYAYFKLHKSHKNLNKENEELKTSRDSEVQDKLKGSGRQSYSSQSEHSFSTSGRTSARDQAYMQSPNDFGRELDMHELYGGDDEIRMSSSLNAQNPLHTPRNSLTSGRPIVSRTSHSHNASSERQSVDMRGSQSSVRRSGGSSRASFNGRSLNRQVQLRELQSPRNSQRAPGWTSS